MKKPRTTQDSIDALGSRLTQQYPCFATESQRATLLQFCKTLVNDLPLHHEETLRRLTGENSDNLEGSLWEYLVFQTLRKIDPKCEWSPPDGASQGADFVLQIANRTVVVEATSIRVKSIENAARFGTLTMTPNPTSPDPIGDFRDAHARSPDGRTSYSRDSVKISADGSFCYETEEEFEFANGDIAMKLRAILADKAKQLLATKTARRVGENFYGVVAIDMSHLPIYQPPNPSNVTGPDNIPGVVYGAGAPVVDMRSGARSVELKTSIDRAAGTSVRLQMYADPEFSPIRCVVEGKLSVDETYGFVIATESRRCWPRCNDRMATFESHWLTKATEPVGNA